MNEQTIINAIETGCRFDSYPSDGAIETMLRWKINDAMRLKGQSGMDEAMAMTICRKVTEVILRDYPSLTDKEFELILEAGVSGEFGKETWVNGANILLWIKTYTRDNSRRNALAELDKPEDKSRKSKAEIDELNKRAVEGKIATASAYYKAKGTIFGDDPAAFHLPQFAAVCYDYLRERGDISEPTPEQIAEADDYAEEKIITSHTRREYIPAARDDWKKSKLLEQYIQTLCRGGLTD